MTKKEIDDLQIGDLIVGTDSLKNHGCVYIISIKQIRQQYVHFDFYNILDDSIRDGGPSQEHKGALEERGYELLKNVDNSLLKRIARIGHTLDNSPGTCFFDMSFNIEKNLIKIIIPHERYRQSIEGMISDKNFDYEITIKKEL